MWTSFRQVEQWHQPFFGQPALLLKDGDQWVLGGPLQAGPRTWQWVAYSGPSTARRILATAKWKVAPRVLRQDRYGGRYLAVRTVTAYYLLSRDPEGLYVTAFARLLPEGWSLATIHDELAAAADWLRQTRAATDQVLRDQSA
ncbi:MAG TPA: hypothetical protein VK898_13210 [Chloroflexota bacterium]|nr:hypothetical protein [Chloroflexota bacterium]